MAKENKRLINKICEAIVNVLAAVIDKHDLAQAYVDRGCLMIKYHVANGLHKRRAFFLEHRKVLLGYFAGALLVAIGIVAMFNYATAYEYSYNGKSLGYVKNQEDVLKILDVASKELTKEYGTRINIDVDSDIEFKRIVSLDKEIDNVDAVLKKLTYMSDMQTEAYAIVIDGKRYAIVKNKETAEDVLKTIQDDYAKPKKKTVYEKVGFKEKVELEPISVKLSAIKNKNKAIRTILSGGEKETVYTVKSGDTYYSICKKFDTTFEQLKKTNPKLKENKLNIGQKIVLSRAVSSLTVTTVEKSTFAEVIEYKTKYKKSSSMYIGDSSVDQKGKNGKRVVTARITKVNGEETKRDILNSEIITKSVTKIVTKGTKERPKTLPTGSFTNPIRSGYVLSSPFGWRWGRMHEGLDMACATGTPIYASDGGTVTYAGVFGGYGNYIEISHGNGKTTRYGHCSAINVSSGQKVYKGQKIGAVGNTGRSTGPHLHFEIRVNGSAVNPFNYF